MALTQQEWFEKLRKWVPQWWFEKEATNVALFNAVAAILEGMGQDTDDHFNATFFTRATAPILDLEGAERSIDRITGETDAAYVARIQRITSLTDKESIRIAVNEVLINPGCVIQEAPTGSPYCNRASFSSRDKYLCAFLEDFFTLILPLQSHAPYTFASRETYASRAGYAGTSEAVDGAFMTVVTLVDYLKSFGVMYRVVESRNRTIFV